MRETFRQHHAHVRTPEDVLAFMGSWLDTVGARVVGGLLSSAWTAPRLRSPSKFLLARLALSERRSDVRAQRLYPSVRLDERWLDRDELLCFIAVLLKIDVTGGGLTGPGPRFHNTRIESIYSLASRDHQSAWAETQIKLANRDDRVDPEWLPAVAAGQPPFSTWAQAVGNWVFGKPVTHGTSLPYMGQLVVILPDTRARAGDLVGTEQGVRIPVEVAIEDDVVVQWLFSKAGVELQQGEVTLRASHELDVPFHEDATQLDVFLLNHGLISHRAYGWGELRAVGKRAGADELQAVVLSELAAGERETVEFKPFITSDAEKLNEIEKTVVAFANTVGGRIYVGVTDEGEPQGRSALRKLRKSADEVTTSTILASLKKLIHDRIKPVPSFSVEETEVFGETVGVIEVEPGPYVYATHNNNVYIRQGSTSRRPDVATELPQLQMKQRMNKPAEDDGEPIY